MNSPMLKLHSVSVNCSFLSIYESMLSIAAIHVTSQINYKYLGISQKEAYEEIEKTSYATDQTFRIGLSYGVSEFEIWDSKEAGGYANFSMDDLQRWKDIIENY